MAAVETISDERRNEIVWLLERRNDHLPLPVRHVEASPGFVNEQRPRTCPDCLANGRTMVGCETCGGSGVVDPKRLGLVAVTDELPDDGTTRDPYANNDTVTLHDRTKHDESHARDRQIEILREQTRPVPTEIELLEEANRRGYAWEEERRAMYRRFDFAALDLALDALRSLDADAGHAINAVYVDGWLAEVGLITPLIEQLCERGLSFLSDRLPEPVRTGLAPAHPAETRQSRRRAA